MGYLVLARKWRPQTFDDVVGQDHIVRTLKNTITSGRIAHAYIFGGQRGVGKTSIARIFAKALNCESGPTETPCNRCIHCREISDGVSLDCREIDGASNRGIDEIRELKENIKFAPISSRYKINIIDEVHMLSREAFNALLKTLEEPPAHVIFIFATTEIRKVPATVMSRCQYYDFRRVSLAQLTESLGKIAQAEGIVVSQGGLRLIAEAGDGSLRDAQSIFDQIISYAGKEIDDTKIVGILGLRDAQFLFRLSDAIGTRDAGQCFAIVEEAYYAGIDILHLYQMLVKHYRKLLLVKVLPENGEALEMSAEERGEYQKRAGGLTLEILQRYLDILLLEEENIARGVQPRIILEMTLLRMALLEPLVPLTPLLKRLGEIERGLRGGGGGGQKIANLPAPRIASATGSKAAVASEGDIGEGDWRQFQNALKTLNKSYNRWLFSGSFVVCSAGEVKIAFERNPLVVQNVTEIFASEEFAAITRDFFGQNLRFCVVHQSCRDQSAYDDCSPEIFDNEVSEKERVLLMESPVTLQIMAAYPDARIAVLRRR